MYQRITEGEVRVDVPTAEKVSREMEVFYNPAMELNRTATVLLLKVASRMPLRAGLPLAGTGIRACRLLVELEPECVHANDASPEAARLIRHNVALNEERLRCDDIEVSCNEASKFLLEGSYNYIDIDPFGSPNPFLDAAVKRLQRGGLLAVTATDTSALSGTYPKACRRKYWAEPLRNHLMHEVGLRILIRKVQLVAAQYEKALVPLYSYAKEHYMRLFLRCEKGKARVEEVLAQHGVLGYDERTLRARAARRGTVAGPLWLGPLWDAGVASRMAALHGEGPHAKFFATVAAEAESDVLGFYPFNLVRQHGKKPAKKARALARKGVWPTHLESNAVRARSLRLLLE